MQTTMDLLEKALEIKNAREWADQLKLSPNALRTAKNRGNLSPAIAGALAEELGLDPKEWIVTAALESERESACKTRMIRRFLGGAAIAAAGMAPATAATVFDMVAHTTAIMSNHKRTRHLVRAAVSKLAAGLTIGNIRRACYA